MQGRFSPQVAGKIQAFPWDHWRSEFTTAAAEGFDLMEWTLDAERLYENPIMTEAGRGEIAVLKARHGVDIDSLTGDFFMQTPFHKASGPERLRRLGDLRAVCEACSRAGIRYLVVPLVDAGRMDSPAQEADVLGTFCSLAPELARLKLAIAFESDYRPRELATFMRSLGPGFGVNYDIGNSASLGYDPEQEIAAFGKSIVNVHVKDRALGGTTVPLGSGNADFPKVFAALRGAGYAGNFVLQTARAPDGDHRGALVRYRQMTERWIAECEHAA